MNWFRKLLGGADGDGGQQPAVTREPVVPVATVQIPPTEPGTLYQDQVLRKAWAEDLLIEAGVPVNKHLPCIEGQAETTLRSAREVADRLLALAIVAVKGEGLEHDRVLQLATERQAWDLFTAKEAAFIRDPSPSEHDRIQFVWRYEAAWVLLWALDPDAGPLPYPDSICDVPLLAQTVRDTPDLAISGLQSANNILNEADLIYRCHWAVRQASIDGTEPPAGLDPGVVMERHYALNWLIGYMDQDWDDISTDT